MNTDKLRILYVLPYTPSPIRVRPYQLIRALAKLGHRVTVVALADGYETEAARRELNNICEAVQIVPHAKWQAAWNCVTALPTPTPLWGAYCRSARMMARLRELAQSGNYDVAHVEHLRAAHFSRVLQPLPTVLDAVDCITALKRQVLDQSQYSRQSVGNGLKRLLEWEEWSKLRRYEPFIYRPYHRIAVTSHHDAASLAALAPMQLPPVDVIPNGVDLDYFQPSLNDSPEADTLVFSGKMSYIANEDAANYLLTDILPRLRQIRPRTHLILAGSSPSPALKARAQQVGNVTVTGFVEDLRPYLSRATVAVCPMRIGVGIQNKALEAMAMGRPVVASPLAGRAIAPATESGGLHIAETVEGFVKQCAGWLAHPEKAARDGAAARRYVEAHHHWQTSAQQFVRLYHIAVEHHAKTAVLSK